MKEELLKQVQNDRKRTPVTWVRLEILKPMIEERTLKGRGYQVCVLKKEIRMTKWSGGGLGWQSSESEKEWERITGIKSVS